MTNIDQATWQRPSTAQLADVLVNVSDIAAMRAFLRDVMTESEIIEISARLEAAKLLRSGATYEEIVAATKLSSRTVARISDWLQNGCGGYDVALQVIAHHDHIPPARAA